jgi:NADH-quinone oxidoreductase subunit C
VNPQEIRDHAAKRFGDTIGELSTLENHLPAFTVQTERWDEVAEYLKFDPDMAFDGLMCVAGVDYPTESLIRCVYLLNSYVHRHHNTVKNETPRDKPRQPTAEPVWKHADWMEREAYDLLGLQFDGHPDLRRVLLPDDWVGHPLRKDYSEPEEYRGIVTWREDLRGQDLD